MSHFSVLVIRHPEQDLAALLQPFHEFECTGNDDQYVQDVDVTDKARAEYESATSSRIRDLDGKLHCPYENQFYRYPTDEERAEIGPIAGTGCGKGMSWTSKDWGDGRGYQTKIKFVPEGWEEVTVMTRDEETFLEWAKGWYGSEPLGHGEKPGERHKYGYIQIDRDGEVAKVIKRTNERAKWDWWCVGGRYSGKFAGANKVAACDDPRNQEPCLICAGTGKRKDALGLEARAKDPNYGCNGCDGKGVTQKFPTKWVQEDNEIRVGDLDLAALKNRAVMDREKWVREIEEKAGLARSELQLALRLDREMHVKWKALPEPRPRGAEHRKWLAETGCDGVLLKLADAHLWDKPDLAEGQTLDQWIAAAPPLTAFAVLKSGEWYERGEMGWWGVVHDEKDKNRWEREFESLLKDLDPEMILTVVDCHI
jgi:hypothetical protein